MATTHPDYLHALPGQLLRMAIYLAVLGAAHWFWLGLKPPILWTLVGVIVACAFVPARFAPFASGAGFLIVGGVAYFVYAHALVGALCAFFGCLSLFDGYRALKA